MLIYLQMLDTPEEKSKFESLYYTHRRTMLHTAMKILKDHPLAEDAVQEAFIRLAKNLYKIDQVDCPQTRMFTVVIVRNISLTMLTDQQKQMDWTLGEPDDATDTSTYYQFSVDGIIVDREGYSVGENVYSGPFASFGSSYVEIYIPFCLEAQGDSLVSAGFVSSEQAKTLCRTDFLAQADYPQIMVFDYAELVYYYQAQQQMLLPAWRITGAFYSLAGDGTLFSGKTTRLIDAQTGELYW